MIHSASGAWSLGRCLTSSLPACAEVGQQATGEGHTSALICGPWDRAGVLPSDVTGILVHSDPLRSGGEIRGD